MSTSNNTPPSKIKSIAKGVGKTALAPVKGAGRLGMRSAGVVAEALYRGAFHGGDQIVAGIADVVGSSLFRNYGRNADNVSANGKVIYDQVKQPDGSYKTVKRILPNGSGSRIFGGGGGGGYGRDLSRSLQAIARQLNDGNKIASQNLKLTSNLSKSTTNLVRVTAKMAASLDTMGQNVVALRTQQDNQRLSDEAYRKSADIKLNDHLDEIKNLLRGKTGNQAPKKSSMFDFLKNALIAGLGIFLNPLKKLTPLLLSASGMLWNVLKGLGGSAISGMLGNGLLRKGIGKVLTGGFGKLGDLARAGKNKLGDLASKGVGAFKNIGSSIKNVATGAKSKIIDLATKFGNLVKGGGVKKLLTIGGRTLLRGLVFVPVIGEVAAGLFLAVELFSLVKDFTKDLNFGDAFSKMGTGILDSFKKLKNGILNLFGMGSPEIPDMSGPENSYGVLKNDKNTQSQTEALDSIKGLSNKYLSVPAIQTPLKLPTVVKPSEIPTGFSTAAYVGAGESSGSYDSINKMDSKGTKSYGKYQFNSGGTVQSFLKTSKYKSEFSGVAVGSDEFDDRWKNLSNSVDDFNREQDDFFMKTYRDGAIKTFKKAYGFEPGQYTEAVITGMKVRGDNVLNNALKNVDPSVYDNDKSLAIGLLEASKKNVSTDYKSGISEGTSTVRGLTARVDDDIERIKSGDLSPSFSQNVKRVGGMAVDEAKEGWEKFTSMADKIGTATTDLFTGKLNVNGIMDNIGELFSGANINKVIASESSSPVQEYLNKKIEENRMYEIQNAQSMANGVGGESSSSSVVSTPISTTNNTTIINNETNSIDRVLTNQYF